MIMRCSAILFRTAVGLSARQTVWDVGTGSGVMAEYFAGIVKEEGTVYALDISPEQIAITRSRIEEAGFSNVKFITADMATAVLPEGKADIVYGRFFLMHQRNPKNVLKKMKSLLKPNGVLVLEEAIMSSLHFPEGNTEFDTYIKTIVALGKHKGVDFDLGSRLAKLCEEEGFNRISSKLMNFNLQTNDIAPTLLARIDELRNGIISAGLANSETLDNWKEAVSRAFSEASSSSYVSSTQGYILAWI